MYPETPKGLEHLGYVSDTARTQTRNLFRPKRADFDQKERCCVTSN